MKKLSYSKWKDVADQLFRDMSIEDGMRRRRANRAYRMLKMFGKPKRPEHMDKVKWLKAPLLLLAMAVIHHQEWTPPEHCERIASVRTIPDMSNLSMSKKTADKKLARHAARHMGATDVKVIGYLMTYNKTEFLSVGNMYVCREEESE